MSEEAKIIGYRLKIKEYTKAVEGIVGTILEKPIVIKEKHHIQALEEAEVLDLWFGKIFDREKTISSVPVGEDESILGYEPEEKKKG